MLGAYRHYHNDVAAYLAPLGRTSA
jgi:hypothetical protein